MRERGRGAHTAVKERGRGAHTAVRERGRGAHTAVRERGRGAHIAMGERGRGAHMAVVTIPMRTPSFLPIDLFVHFHHVLNETFAVVTGSGGVCECSECGYSAAASKRCNIKTKKAVQYE